MLLSTAYFPPVSWFALLARDMTLSPDRVSPSTVFLEACENYQKQSYRNRCYILAGDGPQMLQVPVCHSDEMGISSMLVDYSTPWVEKAERCIETAYRSSAYFEYYRDELFVILDAHPATLWELDMRIIRFFLDRIGLRTELEPTTEFAAEHVHIHPKRPNAILQENGLDRPYYQVFADRHGFVPNLSVMDLLFNEGPASIDYLL